jgi:hypothetical protein
LIVTLVRRPDEIKALTGTDEAIVVFSVECPACKSQMYFEFFESADGAQRVEVTYKAGGTCTKDPNTCTSLFCWWPRCGH